MIFVDYEIQLTSTVYRHFVDLVHRLRIKCSAKADPVGF